MEKDIYHYTTADGLLGIISSGVLWATHYKSLNDPQELQVGLASARRLFNKQIAEVAKKRQLPLTEEELQREGKVFADAFLEAYLSYGEPHIVSFSSHQTVEERENGILSQWRAYGHDSGYAIAFDGVKLGEFVKKLLVEQKYLFLKLQDV